MRSAPVSRLPYRGSILGLAILLALANVAITPVRATDNDPANRQTAAGWTGSVDLYRTGTFTTQQTWLWCTAANIQVARNIVHGERDHGRASQDRYFDWMRTENRYRIPETHGVDPVGWTAGLRRWVDDRYRLRVDRGFDAALRAAVTSMRRTNLPVGLLVARGGHAWLLTGFSATADPATTTDFEVTSVRIVGPLWGLQSRNGYDMRPNTRLTAAELRRFWTPWHYAPIRMAWEGRIVSIQPSATAASVESSRLLPAPAARPLSPTARVGRAATVSGLAGAIVGTDGSRLSLRTDSPARN